MDKKSRFVTFRVSAEEYASLARWAKSSGARSISDFARAAIIDKVENLGAPRISIAGDLTTLGRALGDLDAALGEARKKIQALLGPVSLGAGRE